MSKRNQRFPKIWPKQTKQRKKKESIDAVGTVFFVRSSLKASHVGASYNTQKKYSSMIREA